MKSNDPRFGKELDRTSKGRAKYPARCRNPSAAKDSTVEASDRPASSRAARRRRKNLNDVTPPPELGDNLNA